MSNEQGNRQIRRRSVSVGTEPQTRQGSITIMKEPDVVETAVHPMDQVAVEDYRLATNRVLNWYAVHVKSRHEFVAASELVRKGIEVFVPSVKKQRQWKDRKKLVEFPLFPGYAFVRVPAYPGAFVDVLKTRGIAGFITLEPGSPTQVNSEEIDSLKLLIGSGRDIDVYPGLKEGTRVRIIRGSLINAEGILIRKIDEFVFVVNVEILGRSVAVKIAPHDVNVV